MFRFIATGLFVAMLAPAANAGGYSVGYYGGHHHYAPHHYYPRYRYSRSRHHGHRAGYLAAGLLLGSVISDLSYQRNSRPVVVSRRPVVAPSPARAQNQTAVRGQPAPAQPPAVYLLRTADGQCLLIQRQDDGTELQSVEPADSC